MKRETETFALLTGGLLALGGLWVYRDYHAWLKLGEGGLPANFRGWMHTTRLRFKMRNPFDLTDVRAAQHTGGDIETLHELPPRPSARPKVDQYPVPHRQMTQRPDDHYRKAMQALFDQVVEENKGTVRYALSHFEKHIQAVTSCLTGHRDPVNGSSLGEIAHIHDADGSMHMIMSPSDTIVAIEAGWAQFHGLAGLDHGLPLTYIMIYGPQSDEELAVIGKLLRSSIAYMCGTVARPESSTPAAARSAAAHNGSSYAPQLS